MQNISQQGLGCNVIHHSQRLNCILIALFLSLSPRFLADYDEQFPVADDISLLQQAFPHLYPLPDFERTKGESILQYFRILLKMTLVIPGKTCPNFSCFPTCFIISGALILVLISSKNNIWYLPWMYKVHFIKLPCHEALAAEHIMSVELLQH